MTLYQRIRLKLVAQVPEIKRPWRPQGNLAQAWIKMEKAPLTDESLEDQHFQNYILWIPSESQAMLSSVPTQNQYVYFPPVQIMQPTETLDP